MRWTIESETYVVVGDDVERGEYDLLILLVTWSFHEQVTAFYVKRGLSEGFAPMCSKLEKWKIVIFMLPFTRKYLVHVASYRTQRLIFKI